MPFDQTPLEMTDVILIYFLITFMTFLYENSSYKKELEILRKIYFCGLTGLPNRIKLAKDINEKKDLVLVLLNIDNFKIINGSYGYHTGDQLLTVLAEKLKKLNIPAEIHGIYRMHADEFALLLNGLHNLQEVEMIGYRIHRELSTNYEINKNSIDLSVTVGISDSKRDLVADTEIALHTAKESNKAVAVFDRNKNILDSYRKNLKLLHNLRSGIESKNFVAYYQPIYDNRNGNIRKYECLIRLRDKGSIISPSDFLDIARRAKIYPFITRTVINQSFEYCSGLDIDFSVNLSLEDLLDPETTEYIYTKLKHSRNNRHIIFEILESEKIESLPEIIEFIREIKSFGCRIAIDDFGSGYSNFDLILKLKPDFLKIDGSLIKNIASDKSARILVKTIVAFCREMGIETIAEYVHNKEVFFKVREMGIDYSQGFYIGRPEPEIPSK